MDSDPNTAIMEVKMARMSTNFLVLSLTVSLASAEFPVDPNDDLLLVYRMPDTVAVLYDPNGTSVLGYWSDWEGRDEINMTPTADFSYTGRDNWTGPDDAAMIVRAAASPKGLFFYLEVSDNVWVDKVTGEDSWAFDMADLYLDNKSSDEIAAGGSDSMLSPANGWALTRTIQQYKVWLGAAALPASFQLDYYDFIWPSGGRDDVALGAASAEHDGMSIKAISLDANTKALEGFIPWSWVGNGGISDVSQGTKIGFTVGYNDMDGDSADVKSLRWQRYDPFAPRDSDEPISNNALASWGDMVLVEDMDTDLNATILPTAGRVIIDNARVVARGLHTLDGQRIAVSDAALVRNHSMVIERSVLADGTVSSRMVRTGR